MDTEIPFGAWLRKQRRALDLTRQAFADQVGCAEVTLRRIEAGTLKPSKELASILLEKLDIPEIERAQWISFARGLSGYPLSSTPLSSKRITNLPAPITTFIGRGKEQADVIGLISKHRLITLTGAGGVGKTRLSPKVGEQALSKCPDGVWLVELAPLLHPLLVPRTTAIAIGLRDQPQSPVTDVLSDYLDEKKILIILDNCEHLLNACAQLADTLLKRCPNLKILATSREALGITGEAVYRVPSLGLPDLPELLDTFRNYESIQLFEERAQLVRFDFSLTLENASSVAQICHRLDGIPLAIELAAAKVGVFSTEQIAKQLDESLNVLGGGGRTDLPHHQTLRASIEWSWSWLTESEERLMRQLSMFAGGWTLEAAQATCEGDVLEMTNSLAKKSLIVSNQKMGHETRYRFHETIRQYAHERLLESGETDLLRERNFNYFLRLAEEAELKLRGADQIDWLNRLQLDHENLRAALVWALSNNAEAGLRLVGALWWFWRVCGFVSEGCEWMSKMLALPSGAVRTQLRAKVLYGAAFLEAIRYDNAKAQALYGASLAVYTELADKLGIADSLNGLGFIARRLHDWETARTHFEAGLQIGRETQNKHAVAASLEGLGMIARQYRAWATARTLFEQFLAIERELGNATQIAHALRRLGGIAFEQVDMSLAQSRFEESLSIFRELNFKQFIAIVLNNLANIAQYQGNYEQASTLHSKSLSLLQEKDVGFESNRAMVLCNLGYVAYRQGQQAHARKLFEESLLIYQKLEDKEGSALCLVGLAGLLASDGKPQQAVSHISTAQAVFDKMDIQLDRLDQAEYDHILEIARTQLDKASFEIAWAEGSAIKLADVIAYALGDD
jgi:predicted ATPase/DNA-binding XRE family transcriptional regulator